MHFKHPEFSAPELEALQRELYRQDFLQLGPSLVRLMRIWLQGYKNLRNSPKPLLRARAERQRQEVMAGLPGIYPAMIVGPTPQSRAQARRLFHEICLEMGGLPLRERLKGWATLPLAAWTWLSGKPFRVLAEDLSRNARDLLTGMFPRLASKEEFSTSAATQPLTIDPEN